MNSVFFDTNILLDFILKRKSADKNYYNSSLEVINSCIVNSCSIYVSILSMKDVFYIVSKLTSGQDSRVKQQQIKHKINDLLKLVIPLMTTQEAFYKALNSNFRDFEDALQYYTAKEAGVKSIITRNKRDFSLSKIPVYLPDEFLTLPL